MELGKEPGVQGLVQLGRNAIERVAQLESENSYLRAANSDGAALLQKLRDRIAALEAEKAERERQEPILWWDGDKIVSENRKYLFPFVNPPQPLYAHPLALREPTEVECREIRRLAKNEECDGSKVCEGRAMFKAVREVMAK